MEQFFIIILTRHYSLLARCEEDSEAEKSNVPCSWFSEIEQHTMLTATQYPWTNSLCRLRRSGSETTYDSWTLRSTCATRSSSPGDRKHSAIFSSGREDSSEPTTHQQPSAMHRSPQPSK